MKYLCVALFLGSLIYFFIPYFPEKFPEIDLIRIEKEKRLMHVYHKEHLLKTYTIALGFSPKGHKMLEGDGKTPEGLYFISMKNPKSKFYLSVKISYPNSQDLQNALKNNVSSGGNIMIHGLPYFLGWTWRFHDFIDWTAGCIAVTNREIEEIYTATSIGTKVEILP